MMEHFNKLVAGFRYLFIVVVILLLVMAVGSFVAALSTAARSLAGPAGLGPETSIALMAGSIRAAFLYFLAVAVAGLFLGDVPAPQWMTVRNLHQLRTKVLTFVSIILPLAFMGRFAHSDMAAKDLLYAGGAVFLVLGGIYLLVRHGTSSGDELQAREGNRAPDRARRQDARPGRHKRDSGREGGRDSGRHRDDKRIDKQKENFKFRKDSLRDTPEGEKPDGGRGNVTVKPGPRRPRRR